MRWDFSVVPEMSQPPPGGGGNKIYLPPPRGGLTFPLPVAPPHGFSSSHQYVAVLPIPPPPPPPPQSHPIPYTIKSAPIFPKKPKKSISFGISFSPHHCPRKLLLMPLLRPRFPPPCCQVTHSTHPTPPTAPQRISLSSEYAGARKGADGRQCSDELNTPRGGGNRTSIFLANLIIPPSSGSGSVPSYRHTASYGLAACRR